MAAAGFRSALRAFWSALRPVDCRAVRHGRTWRGPCVLLWPGGKVQVVVAEAVRRPDRAPVEEHGGGCEEEGGSGQTPVLPADAIGPSMAREQGMNW
jgi:hypothetical protein